MRKSALAGILCIVPALAVGQQKDALVTAQELQQNWLACAELAAASGAAQAIDLIGPAENVFRNCDTEEQLFLAFVRGAAPTKTASDAMIITHFKSKLALKKRITDDHFKEIARQIGKQ